MGVFASLAREHRLFSSVGLQCEFSLDREERIARRKVAEAMRVLLPALERHEEVESLLFGDADYAEREARRVLALVAAQHGEIEALRAEIEALLPNAEHCDFGRLKSGVLRLVQGLKFHFETEENLLWPFYNSLGSRSIRRSLAHEVGEKIDQMEKGMKKSWAAIADYLEKEP